MSESPDKPTDPTAPPGARMQEFTEPGAVEARFRQFYAAASLDFPPATPILWRSVMVPFGPLGLVHGLVPGGVRIATQEPADRYVLVISEVGGAAVDHRGVRGATGPGRAAALFSLMHPSVLEMAPGSLQRTFILPRNIVEEHLRRLTGIAPHQPLGFPPLVNLDTAAGARLERVTAFTAAEIDRLGSAEASPLFARSLVETFLTALLDLLPHEPAGSMTLAPASVAPRCVRFAEAFIDAHAGQHITVPDVAAAVGVSVRGLQTAFRHFRNRSPLEYLKARRFDVARARLLAPTPDLTVHQVAIDAGYRHAGYFIREYRQRFGESPADTLRRILGPPRQLP